MKSLNKVIWGILALVAIIAIGTIGYEIIEGWSFLDSIFMTITTITTVGYREVHPLSDGGRIFSIFLILGGMGGAFYTLTGIITYIIEGNLGATWGRRRMENKINQLKDHFILCGFGRVGEEIANIFKEEEVPFVVIDNRPECAARAEHAGYLYVEGDATSDEILKEAGIEKARGLVAALGSDIDNTYITLSARGLYPSLFITARASDSQAEKKLRIYLYFSAAGKCHLAFSIRFATPPLGSDELDYAITVRCSVREVFFPFFFSRQQRSVPGRTAGP